MNTTTMPIAASHVTDPARFDDVNIRWDGIAAVFRREWFVFKRIWRGPTFGSIFEPLIYLVAFGYGFGALVAEVAGRPYLDFMATGSAAISILFTGAFPALINGYFRRNETRLYDGMIAAPLEVRELITGEALWLSMRTAASTVVTLMVAAAFGVALSPTVVLAPVVGFLGGFVFACLGASFATKVTNGHQFDFVIAGFIVPMFVIAGTFFPLDDAPVWLRVPALANPLFHVTRLIRAAAFSTGSATEIAVSLTILLAHGVLWWWLAQRWLQRALVD
ncbi:MAG: lipooligosaccharide transport system permease protein [Glaciecola sp.]|jgi:lipooligosaccharide transport system permease protein